MGICACGNEAVTLHILMGTVICVRVAWPGVHAASNQLISHLFVHQLPCCYCNEISDVMQSVYTSVLKSGDKYELSSQKDIRHSWGRRETLYVDDASEHTLRVRRKCFCKVDGSCWASSMKSHRFKKRERENLVLCEFCICLCSLAFTRLLE